MNNVLTVDVEEYFHPTEVQLHVKTTDWQAFPSRIDRQVDRILAVFDAHRVSATFFILGWIAERHPHVVRAIAARGHDIGCHSYAHRMVSTLTPQEFREDTRRAVVAIEDACGVTPRCYRAPSYSVTSACLWSLEILIECGFSHDSSIYPICHDRYGIPGFSRHATFLWTPSGPIFEIPIATVQLGGGNVAPVGGGGYLRLLPYAYTAAGIRRVNDSESKPVCMYFHPWEIDPDQPRLPLGWLSRIRTYTGLRSMSSKIERLLTDFAFSSVNAVYPQSRPIKNSAVACGAYR
jgi:polysaccharide deacetylase family protein (PEP-CTERM system associated)